MVTEFAFGTQGWSYADWVGGMYDAATKPERYLRAYSEEFRTVEIDSTFYGTPSVERVRRWCMQVPQGFRFALKCPRAITHERRLVACEEELDAFLHVARAFGDALAPVLVQLPPDFTPAELGAVRAFVPLLPGREMEIAFEVRDPGWFAGDVADELHALLAAQNVALAVSDAPFVPLETMLAAFARPTADFAYVRLIGDHDALDRFDRVVIDRSSNLARWAKALAEAPPRIRKIYGYVNNHYAGHAPAVVRNLYRALHIAHTQPARIEQTSLF